MVFKTILELQFDRGNLLAAEIMVVSLIRIIPINSIRCIKAVDDSTNLANLL